MTSSLAVMPLPQRAQRFTQNNLQQLTIELLYWLNINLYRTAASNIKLLNKYLNKTRSLKQI